MKLFLPVLVYQKIGTPPKHSHLKNEWTSAQKLEKMLAWLTQQKYTFITPLDLQKKLPAKPVLLVFVGGYESVYTEVFPLLKKYHACATVCLAQEPIGTYNQWQDPYQEPWQNLLTPKQLDALRKSNLVQFGTLGLTGHNLLEDEPTAAQQNLLESIHRLKILYKISPCAVAFWPWAADPQNQSLTIGNRFDLPVITSQPGKNTLTEKKFLRILRPHVFTKFLLWKNK